MGISVDVGGCAENVVGAGVGAEEVGGEMLKAGFVGGVRLELLADEAVGRSKKLLESDVGAAFTSGVAGVAGARVKGAARTDGDWTIGDWSSARRVAPFAIGAWNWLPGGVGAGEAAVAAETGVGKTGATEMGPGGVENGVGAAESWVGTLGNECAVSEAA